MCHLVGISHHYKIVFMSSTTLHRAVSRARTWFTAVYRWVILPSGISSDCRWPLDVAGRKLCVKWDMNILVTFCINFATRSASRHSLFQVSYNNCNPGGPVGLPQGCKPIHWNPNTFLEKKVCWQIAQKLQKTSVANFTYLFWTLYFASRTKNKLKQLYFNGAVSMFFQQSLHLPKNKQPKWRLLWSHDPWDLISWFPLPSLGPSPMENPMLKG